MKNLALPAAMADPTLSLQWARRAAVLLMAYYVVGRLSLSIPQIGPQVSLVWPPAGIALVALLRFGPALWPAVWVGALLVAVSTGLGVGIAAMMAIGSAAGPALGAAWMRRLGLHHGLDRRRDLWIFGLVGVGAAMALTAVNCVLWTAVDGAIAWRDLAAACAYWWLGDAMGVAVVGVPLLTLSRATLRRALAGRAWLPTAALATAALASAWLAFGTPSGSAVLSPYVFVPPLALCWLAARSGIFAASTVVFAISAIAVLATGLGHGPFHAPDDVDRSIALLSGYVCALSAMPLLVTALIGEIDSTEQRWRETLDGSHIGSAAWDLRSGRIELSARWQALLGHDAHAWRADAEALWHRLHLDEAAGVRARFEVLGRAEAAPHDRLECRMRRRDGSWMWLELHAFVTECDARGQPLRVIITARDAAEQLAAREQRTLSENLFLHLHEGLLITDAAHRVLEVNPTYCEITGQTRAELIGNVPPLLRELQARRAAEAGTAHDAGPWRGEIAERRRNGEPCTLQVTVSDVRGPDAALRHHVIAVTDVTQARAHVDQLRLRTQFDELTRLPNRARLALLLQDAIESGRSAGTLLTVCCLDLDHFKSVNEHHGPAAGDRLLVETAERLRRSLRSWAGGDDVAARIGGDEFVLLLHTATLEESRHAVARLLRQVGQPVTVGDTELAVTASIGATVFPFDRADAETLLRHADHAMYGAKQAGRNGYLFFDAETDRRTEARFVALGRIQEALDAGELCLHYQPKVDLRSGRPVGMEALLRWNHPADGMVPPAQFLPLIEHTGLGVTVGRWVIQQALAELDRWLADGLALTLSVNVSARHLQEPAFAAQLEAMLAGYRTPVGAHLVLEILETTALADIDFTRRLMDACRTLGVRFALDDFGTGYSTFTYLKRLPLDMLKIDRSFVANMLHDAHDLAIVEGVVGLARTFGCSVVAEGVETLEQARGLAAIGCDIGQGHGIAKAMPAEAVAAWVRGRTAESSAWPGA